MPRVNQQQLAQQLNLSQTTVSRALQNHPSINAETKAQVWSLAAQLGYRMPGAKKSLPRSSASIVIGVMIAIPKRFRGGTETSQLVLQGIAERGSNESVTLDILYHEPSEHDPRAIQRRLRQSRWKGCILIHPMADEVVDRLSKTVPCVSVVENYRRDFIDSIDVDQNEAICTLVRRLHLKGHTNIGFLSWRYDVPAPWVYHRFGAYVESLFQLGLKFDPRRTINVTAEEELAPADVRDRVMAELEKGTTAFVCAADHQAYDMRRLLRERGVRVPEDCSLTGFDGIPPPPGESQIATIRVPYDEIGRSAFHQLMHRLTVPSAPRRHVLVDGELDEGDSLVDRSKSTELQAQLA